jgi:single-stranded DNA-specific DHH superfamily exonuclease
MLSSVRLHELKALLQSAQMPVFLFDNDADGLCSFLIARRALGVGEGIPVRTYPSLDPAYVDKAVGYGADMIVVLDKPFLSEVFITRVIESGLPLVIIDHHAIPQPAWQNVYPHCSVFNPALERNASAEPVSYILFRALGRADDLWLAGAGCIADHHLPDFWEEVVERYPEYAHAIKSPFEGYYETDLGRLAQSFNFGLKDSLSAVKKLLAHLIRCAGPSDVLGEQAPSSFRTKVQTLQTALEQHVRDAGIPSEGMIVYQYGGATSMSADIANKLSYRYSSSLIVVIYLNGATANVSLRGKNVQVLFEKILPAFPSASGGGHADAIGARLLARDVPQFINRLKEERA